MHVLITKDSATKIHREVRDLDEARSFASQGFVVELIGEDGVPAPLPDESEAAIDAEAPPAKKTKAKKT